ncbi:glycosyltransferase [Actinoplanes missouriensis]|uniref:glycosyltransferase n=1 Tax=Actinoplanes missouriensis TaxID=1866 RepID=UPI0002F462E7|nr:glycosyltransferase [Actinoplanes missouriensis]
MTSRRVLIVAAPLLGHVFPLVPTAASLRKAGHEVLVATAAEALKVPLPTHDIAPGFRFGPVAAGAMLRHPLRIRAELSGTAGTEMVGALFGAVNRRLLPGLRTLVREWRPDLIIHEPLAAAAATLGVPTVLHENSLYAGPPLVTATAGDVPPPVATITIAPPSVAGPRAGLPMRAVPHGLDDALPGWLTEPSPRPRVLVSRSTVTQPGPERLMSRVIAAAASIDADFVLVRPDARAAAQTLPPTVRVTEWLPLSPAMAVSSAIIHHGGAGTVLAALHAGIPQLVVRGAGDRRHNAELVAARGAGIAVDGRQVGPEVISRLLTDASLASAAREVSAEIAAMPHPDEVVADLPGL